MNSVTFAPINFIGMKYVSLAISILAILGVGVLLFKGDKPSKASPKVITKDASGKEVITAGSKVAFIDSDTLEEHNSFFQKKKKEIEQLDNANQALLKREYGALENEMGAFQQKIQSGGIDEKEAVVTRDRLLAKQAALDKKRESMGTSLENQTEDFRQAWSDKVREKAKAYAEENGFDVIMLGNRSGNGVVYFADELDITKDMTKIMEEVGEITIKPKNK